VRFGWTPRDVDKLKVSEFWRYLELLDDLQKRESGEAKKFDMLNDPRYEAK
jgi:hypothetical protein